MCRVGYQKLSINKLVYKDCGTPFRLKKMPFMTLNTAVQTSCFLEGTEFTCRAHMYTTVDLSGYLLIIYFTNTIPHVSKTVLVYRLLKRRLELNMFIKGKQLGLVICWAVQIGKSKSVHAQIYVSRLQKYTFVRMRSPDVETCQVICIQREMIVAVIAIHHSPTFNPFFP